MLPLLYECKTNKKTLASNAITYVGRITTCTKCVVTEERNGDYTLLAELSTLDELAGSISCQMLICCLGNPFDDPQYFEIYDVTVDISNSKITVEAKHIKHSCYNNVVSSGGAADSFTGTPKQAYDFINKSDYLDLDNPFDFESDITELTEWELGFSQVCTLGEWFGGREGSLLDKFRGCYHWDNFNISYNKSRGKKSGYCLRWGSNISSISQSLNSEKTISHVAAYATVFDKHSNKNIQRYATVEVENTESKLNKIYLFDASSEVGEWTVDVSTGLNVSYVEDACKAAAEKYIQSQDGTIDVIASNIKVNVRAELDDMAELGMDDTVTVMINDKGDTTTAKIVKTEFDSLRERWNLLELGTLKTKLSDYILRR
jgi:phage-related protein